MLNQQDIKNVNYEILVINDGSTDGSAAIIAGYVARDQLVLVLTQQNQGLSMARNNAIEPASEKYFCILDENDEVSLSIVYKL